MKPLRTSAFLLLLANPSHAQPTTDVTGCPFDSASLSAAIALEDQAAGRPSAGNVHVTCSPDGSALVRTETIARSASRTVDLADVPASLAPRVIALVAVTLLHEPPAPAPETETETETEPEPETETAPRDRAPRPRPATEPRDRAPRPSPATEPRDRAPRPRPATAPRDRAPQPRPSTATATAPSPRPSLLTSTRPISVSSPPGVSARALARMHDRTSTLFGAAVSLTSSAASLGVSAASTRIEHSLGTLTPVLVAAHANVAILCTHAACLSLDGELGALTVHASATNPMSVTSRDLSSLYAHAAVELSLVGRIAGTDVAAIAALGASRGVIARVDTEAAAVLAGWTLGAALEVRR